MPKTKLSLDDIEEIKRSKNVLSATEIQNKYGIGWNRLQKLWAPKLQIATLPGNPLPDNHFQITKQDNITPEDLILNLKIIAEESRKQTELLALLLEKQEEVEEEEEIVIEEVIEEKEEKEEKEEEKKQTFSIQDIGRLITEFKNMGSIYVGLSAIISVWLITRKQTKKEISPLDEDDFHNNSLPKPIETTKPSLFKKEIDPFEF